VKGFEYHHDLVERLLPGRDFVQNLPNQASIFWIFYWAMTGLHGLHVVVGGTILLVIACLSWRKDVSGEDTNSIETAGLYWHFVDIVWICLYPTLYLISRHT
jgi:cytochrome c oxidase subunit 3